MRRAWVFTVAAYILALAMVVVVNRETFAIYVIARWPPSRTRRPRCASSGTP